MSISPRNKGKLWKERYGSLRIDEVPDVNDEEEETDTFLGRSIYKKEKSPANINEYLAKTEENLIHFKALAKYYGVGSHFVKLPEIFEKAIHEKFIV